MLLALAARWEGGAAPQQLGATVDWQRRLARRTGSANQQLSGFAREGAHAGAQQGETEQPGVSPCSHAVSVACSRGAAAATLASSTAIPAHASGLIPALTKRCHSRLPPSPRPRPSAQVRWPWCSRAVPEVVPLKEGPGEQPWRLSSGLRRVLACLGTQHLLLMALISELPRFHV